MPTRAAALMTAVVCSLERLAQLQDDSAAAKDLAASIRSQICDWKAQMDVSAAILQRLVDTKVHRVSIAGHRPSSMSACHHTTLPIHNAYLYLFACTSAL